MHKITTDSQLLSKSAIHCQSNQISLITGNLLELTPNCMLRLSTLSDDKAAQVTIDRLSKSSQTGPDTAESQS